MKVGTAGLADRAQGAAGADELEEHAKRIEQRRELPWVPVEGLQVRDRRRAGSRPFQGRPQLLIYHLMLGRTGRLPVRAALRSPTGWVAWSCI
jgi:predicted dithiol-disulfide oxidoreductase (DUF899 family)